MPQPLPADITYFRLKMVDLDGKTNYSGVVTLHTETVETMKLVNTYSTDKLLIKHPATYNNSLVKIANSTGQLVATGKLQTGTTLTSFNVSHLPDGMYFLIIESGIDRLATKFFKGH